MAPAERSVNRILLNEILCLKYRKCRTWRLALTKNAGKIILKKIWRIKNFAENLHNNLIGHGTKI